MVCSKRDLMFYFDIFRGSDGWLAQKGKQGNIFLLSLIERDKVTFGPKFGNFFQFGP